MQSSLDMLAANQSHSEIPAETPAAEPQRRPTRAEVANMTPEQKYYYNLEKAREYQRRYQAANRDRINARTRNYYHTVTKQRLETDIEYAEKMREKHRQKYLKNRDKIIAMHRQKTIERKAAKAANAQTSG